MDIQEMHEYLVDMGIATDDEVSLVTSINGYNEESMESILYVRTGYRSFEQLDEMEDD